MASKTLKLKVAGKEFAATLDSKVSKDDLYGRVDQVVEQDGDVLEPELCPGISRPPDVTTAVEQPVQ